jgi:endonuclease G, mitochondrial
MAVKKRATKKKTARKSASPRKGAKQKTPSRLKQFLFLAGACLCVIALWLTGAYYFGSFETRAKVNHQTMRALNTVRTPAWIPHPISVVFDRIYDAVPSSEGMVVEGGELGRSDSSILAGIPQSRKAMRVLNNTSYINLYDEKERQTLCIAFRVSDGPDKKATISSELFEDPRVSAVRASEMRLGKWVPTPIAPPIALAKEFGPIGADEAKLTTNCAPMPQNYAAGIWDDAMTTIAEHYPKRFGELWIYTGPAYRKESSKLSSGILIPDAFYIIAFDLTDSGGLRALSLLIPTVAKPNTNLSECITSINQIEQVTGLQFLPEIGFDSRELLNTFVSPNLW